MSRWTDRVQTSIVNPSVRLLLRAPLHDLLSSRVAVVSVRGRRSGRQIGVPVLYVRHGDALTLVSRRSRLWWRNLGDDRSSRVRLRGVEYGARAEVSHDAARVEAAVRAVGGGRLVLPVADAVAITLRLGSPVQAARERPGLWRSWFFAVTLGEIFGFAVPALAAAAVADPAWGTLGIAPLIQAGVIVTAGLAEGAVLGAAQAYTLRQWLPDISTVQWVKATAGGAGIAWVIGSLPVVLGERLLSWHPVVLGALGMLLLAAMGALQWRLLRRHIRRAGWWIPATAGAWLVALAAFAAVTTPLWQEGQAGWLVAVIGLLGGVVMAATVAALSGLVVRWLVGSAAADPAAGDRLLAA
ncbi:nitroreductase/quinone reductase family protein [Nonomuraea soli]|uniref:Nitroreductase family deazaflavin-dependent oxidoreductase n=1 Tax=Nonomuraea soli TaxID=1032476 RepID=A0A7W0HNY1_9ACTN|nr:nitroreductase/quinone reductase family protein [Nonomuraea soli]MBA2890051.1 hypothetical protein [Nonomuraea soli]